MKNVMLRVSVMVMSGVSLLLFVACGGGGSDGVGSGSFGTISVGITDASGMYNSVVLTVVEVGAVVSGDETTYYNSSVIGVLPVKVDVLDFANEEFFQLSDIEVPLPEDGGEVCFNQIRLVLAADKDAKQKLEKNPICSGQYCNYVITSAGTFPLKTPSAQQSGVKIKEAIKASTGFCVSEGQSTVQVLIDFDPAKAINHNKGTNEFILKPTSLRIIQGEWSSPPQSFMTGLVAVPTYNSSAGCEVLVDVNSDLAVVAAKEQGGELVVRTGALMEGPVSNSMVCEEWCAELAGSGYNSCSLECGEELNSACYYSGAFKLMLPEDKPYDVTARWEGASDSAQGVEYNTSVLMLLE